MSRSEHERGPEQHHLAVVAIRERDEALVRAGEAEGEAESLRHELAGAVEALQAIYDRHHMTGDGSAGRISGDALRRLGIDPDAGGTE
jgi:hypothetical protein